MNVRSAHLSALFSTGIEQPAPLSPREKRMRRAALFTEPFGVAMRRRARALARALHPQRLANLLPGLDFILRERVIAPSGMPDPKSALKRPDGLCGLVSDTAPETVMEGFARGLFPSADCGPMKWWSPARRQTLRTSAFRLTNEARRLLRREDMTFLLDADFDLTLTAHARMRWGWLSGRLLSPRGLSLLAETSDLGYAHSIDVWDRSGRRVAGAFGVAVGKIFVTLGAFGQDMHHADAALAVLNRHLRQKGFLLQDFVGDADVARLGFEPMERNVFLAVLSSNGALGRTERWKIDPLLCSRTGQAEPGAEAKPEETQEPRAA